MTSLHTRSSLPEFVPFFTKTTMVNIKERICGMNMYVFFVRHEFAGARPCNVCTEGRGSDVCEGQQLEIDGLGILVL
jgi:hypothetical protein